MFFGYRQCLTTWRATTKSDDHDEAAPKEIDESNDGAFEFEVPDILKHICEQ